MHALVFTAALFLQDEASLKRYFESKPVRVKIDMPGNEDGVDLFPQREPVLDANRYSARRVRHQIALRQGDEAVVTLIRVKGKNIEFHLNGGGYSGASVAPRLPSVTKSRYERDLENDLKNATDSRERSRIQSALSRERSRRYADERERDRRQRELEIQMRPEFERREREGGSRFNLWFKDGYLKESVPTPDHLMKLLADYVDFSPRTGEPRLSPSNAPPSFRTVGAPPVPLSPAPPPASRDIRRGMTRDEVAQLLGSPRATQVSRQGDLDTITDTYEDGDRVTTITFVNGVVVKFAVTSK
ncbi:MAG: hypothetical protein K2Q23_19005 [Bryobacteraceae bacterium]|nr:hypothetical protein [Bryobacteraceae bacterium]